MRALEGITVIALEQALAAPLATRHLADLGARVIKIERPGEGDFARKYDSRARGLSSYFVWSNRSKESLTLDVKHPEAREILDRLISRADVFVQNLAPGASARLGLSYEALHVRHPRLIVCDVSGYGLDGPYRDKKAYDLLIQAEAGLVSLTGTPDSPAKAGISIADTAAGMYAYSSILAALIERGRSGVGKHLDISLLEALTEWVHQPLYYAMDGAEPPPRAGAAHPSIYPYGPFTAGDGKQVLFGMQNEREWQTFCARVLMQPEIATDPRFDTNEKRSAHRAELQRNIEGAFAHLTAAQVIERLDAAPIGNARINTMADVWAHPQLQARARWGNVETPAGSMPALLPPGQNDPRMDPVPAMAEHTEAILSELGYSRDDIARLRTEKAI